MTDAAPTAPVRTPYEAFGGEPGVRRLVDAFYDVMEGDPAAAGIRAMHDDDLEPIRTRLTDWLTVWMGGPPVYAERHPGRPCIMSAHAPFAIGAAEADQWLDCMRKAMLLEPPPSEWREALDTAFARMCQGLRNA